MNNRMKRTIVTRKDNSVRMWNDSARVRMNKRYRSSDSARVKLSNERGKNNISI